MPYLNLDLDWFGHRKAVRLVGLLGQGADLYPIKLWAYVGKHHAETGRLEGYSEREIESICGWQGEPGKLVQISGPAAPLSANPRRGVVEHREFIRVRNGRR